MLVGTRVGRGIGKLVVVQQRLDRRNVAGEDLVEPAIPAQCAQSFVKPEVGPSDGGEVAGPCRSSDLDDHSGEHPDGVRVGTQGEEASGATLDRSTYLVDLTNIIRAEGDHERPTPRLFLDETIGDEHLEGLADRAPTHAEAGGQFRLHEMGASPQPTAQDLFAQDRRGVLSELPRDDERREVGEVVEPGGVEEVGAISPRGGVVAAGLGLLAGRHAFAASSLRHRTSRVGLAISRRGGRGLVDSLPVTSGAEPSC